jgi:DNA-binding transcriptional LysR family regulator
MSVDNWDEIRTAYHVARLGTVSGAAEALGVHHATVIRHIDALEKRLEAKLFQRHARGYTATEAGEDLLKVAQATDDQFTQLSGRIKGQGKAVTGDLILTTIPGLSPVLIPCLARFQAAHQGLVVHLLTDNRVYRLQYGEAHVAIRAGAQPDEPDNVVQPFMVQRFGLYASKSYAAAHGLPAGIDDLAKHRFVGASNAEARAPFHRWLRDTVPDTAITFRGNEMRALHQAVRAGAGIGFVSQMVAANDPDLIEAMAPLDVWHTPLWLVTHVDLHRTTKVQTFLSFLKDAATTMFPDSCKDMAAQD